MKRVLAGAGTLAGLVLVLVAVMGFVLLGTSGTWHSEVQVPAGRTAVVIDPALASVLGPQIQIDARAVDSSAPLFVGWARPDDTAELLRGTDLLRLTGLDGARKVSVASSDGDQLLPAPDELDIWHSQTVGAAKVTLTYQAQPGADAVVIASENGAPLPALSVGLRWSDRSWLLLPGLLLALGLALVLLLRRWYRPATPITRRRMAASARRRSVEAPEPPPRVGRRRAAAQEGQQ